MPKCRDCKYMRVLGSPWRSVRHGHNHCLQGTIVESVRVPNCPACNGTGRVGLLTWWRQRKERKGNAEL